jgi:hypothetical protein
MERSGRIDIRIDALEVEGLSRAEAPRYRHDVEHELARLVRENGLPDQPPQPRSLVTVTITSGERVPGAGQDRLAADVAGAIYQVLSQ